MRWAAFRRPESTAQTAAVATLVVALAASSPSLCFFSSASGVSALFADHPIPPSDTLNTLGDASAADFVVGAGVGVSAPTSDNSPSLAEGSSGGRLKISGGNLAVDLSGTVDVNVAAAESDLGGSDLGGRMPLFRLGSPRLGMGRGADLSGPSLHLLASYDFGKVWYGVRSIGVGLAWEGRKILNRRREDRRRGGGSQARLSVKEEHGRDEKRASSSLSDNLSRCSLRLRSDLDLSSRSNSAELELTKRMDAGGGSFPAMHPPLVCLRVDGITLGETLGTLDAENDDRSESTTMSALSRAVSTWVSRWDASSATVSLRAPIHRRVDVVSRSTIFLDLGKFSSSSLSSRIPPLTTPAGWSSGTWLPDVRVSTSGDVVGRSEVGFCGPMELPPRFARLERAVRAATGAASEMLPVLNVGNLGGGYSGGAGTPLPVLWAGGAGVRLTVRRRVNWSLFQHFAGRTTLPEDGGDEEGRRDTTVRLQLCGVDRSGSSYSSVTLEAALEQVWESARMTLAQEQLIQRL